MNRRTELLQTALKPSMSIVVYKSANEISGHTQYYLESHSINEEGQVLEGKPILQESIAEMVEFFYEDQKDRTLIKGFVPENVLGYTPLSGKQYKLVWYRPAEVRYIHFSNTLKIPSGKVWVPPIVYYVNREELFVFALKSDNRPAEKSKMYRGPFHNVSDAGEVCLGNAKVKKPTEKTFTNVMKYWEDLFWLSEFSHINGNDRPVKTDVDKVWTRLVKSKCRLKWESLDELKPTKKTLQNLI